jgi:hypothetical protein
MKALPILWGVAKAAVTALVAFAVLSVPSGKFETVVVSALVMLYVLTRAGVVANHRLLLAMSAAQLRQFTELAERLNHPNLDSFRETLKRDGDLYQSGNVPTLIEGVTLGIIWLAALLVLLSAL